jgi:UDPglucose--hexose-1-phosphate uridylyltransferase
MSNLSTLNKHSHRRLNILTNEWVLVSPHRTNRPWQGKEEGLSNERRKSYDATCYLCPNNERANGERNPDFTSTFVFSNDFAAIEKDVSKEEFSEGLLEAKSEGGLCKVICFSADHSKSLPELEISEIEQVVQTWIQEFNKLSKLDQINHIQIFENKGAIMGCSNPHPHGQIWAQESIPVEVETKSKTQLNYYATHSKSLLEEYCRQELQHEERVLFENEEMIVLVPFWAVWPFETMIIPKRRMAWISEMTEKERNSFAEAIRWVTIKYDNLFKTSFPYSSGIHQAPTDGGCYPEWHWHMSFFPPLLRSATVKKFMVGYEMFASPQRDITPEGACQTLKSQSDIHFSKS